MSSGEGVLGNLAPACFDSLEVYGAQIGRFRSVERCYVSIFSPLVLVGKDMTVTALLGKATDEAHHFGGQARTVASDRYD